MFTLDISLDNEALYEDCKVHRYGVKRPRIDSTMFEAFDIVQKNAERIFLAHGFSQENKGDLILFTGSMKAWAVAAIVALAPEFFKNGDIEDESGRHPLFRSDE